MKVLKVKSRTYKDKNYYKYRINLPEKLLKKANISESDELEAEVKNGKIVLRKKKKNE
ncbi:AbrB/MazE/SpoVT family DNA-binding domain-containing protein [Candidatus Pacearchaeota archaeon]|nr:AbrB/MazE/SpoVT family DNA-binding domain-containing protein [Candidatus Pacearchaeota archaeon]